MRRDVLFRQADFLPKSLHSRIAANQSKFGECQRPADSERSSHGSTIQSFQRAVLVAQAGEDHGVVELVRRKTGREFLRLFQAAGARISITKSAPILNTAVEVS